jgi:hypothetical protein
MSYDQGLWWDNTRFWFLPVCGEVFGTNEVIPCARDGRVEHKHVAQTSYGL